MSDEVENLKMGIEDLEKAIELLRSLILEELRTDLIKKEMIEICEKKLGGKIVMAIDDRDSVVKMWRENGITCLQCAYGDF